MANTAFPVAVGGQKLAGRPQAGQRSTTLIEPSASMNELRKEYLAAFLLRIMPIRFLPHSEL